jgi:hypothetical protein
LDEFRGGTHCGAALASGFEEDDGAGGGDVEGTDASGHGNAQVVVAGAADEIVQARALAAEDDDEIAGEVELVVVSGATFVESDDPKVTGLEVFEDADQVDHADDAKVLGGAGAGFDGGGAQGRGAALGEDYAVDAGAIGHAEQSAEVLRVFDAIEGEDETGGGAGRWRSKQIFDGGKFLRADEGDDALVRGGLGGERELFAWLLENADADLAALGDEASQTRIVTLAGHKNMVKAALAGLEGLLDRVQTVENFHEF